MSLIKIQTAKRSHELINTEFVSRVTVYGLDLGACIWMNGDDEGISVDHAEWSKIEPLLTGETPAPSPIDPPHVDEAWWSLFNNLLTDIVQGIAVYDRVKEITHHVSTYRGLPDDVIAAWRKAQHVHPVSLRDRLIDLDEVVAKYIPTAIEEGDGNE